MDGTSTILHLAQTDSTYVICVVEMVSGVLEHYCRWSRSRTDLKIV